MPTMTLSTPTTTSSALFLAATLAILFVQLQHFNASAFTFSPATTTKKSQLGHPSCNSDHLHNFHSSLTAKANDANDDHDKIININDNTEDEEFYEQDDDYDSMPLWRIEEVDRIFDANLDSPFYPNPLSRKNKTPDAWFVEPDDAVAARVNVDVHQTCIIDQEAAAPAFILAGPRKEIAFDPDLSRAAIVTCGGLCPGLNTVVREVVMCLRRQYGVEHVYGIPEGYRGFLDPSIWRPLDEATVANYHNMGGSILGSSRGGHDTNAIVEALVTQNINLLFVVGGDGTLRGAAKISEETQRRGLRISVVSIPKTIDNDIPLSTRYLQSCCLCGLCTLPIEAFLFVAHTLCLVYSQLIEPLVLKRQWKPHERPLMWPTLKQKAFLSVLGLSK